jgi:predicted membrane GTPase involved in stress response
VVTRQVEGTVREPLELLLLDVPEDYIGVVSQLLAVRRGGMTRMTHTGSGRVRLEAGIEWIGDDELVEVTPTSIRLRKRVPR